MRVAELTGEPILHGGQEMFILNLLKNISDPKIQMDVITPYNCDNSSFEETLAARSGKLIQLGMDFSPGKSRRSLLKPVYTVLKSGGYDAVHIHSGSISVLAYCALAAHMAGCKRVIVHSHSTGVPAVKHELIKHACSPLLKAYPTDWLACSQKAGEDKFPKNIVAKKMVVVKNGIDLQQFQRNRELGQKVRKLLGISPAAFVIGHVGRFSNEKNHLFLVDAFAAVHKQKPESYLLLIGEGELETTVKERVHALGLNRCVFFTGAVDNVSAYYNAMDCFALPSLYEGFGYVLLEAEANGLPCLISNTVPDDAVLNNNVTKLPLEKSLWVEKLLQADSQERIEDQSAIIKAGFSVRETAKAVEAIYRKESAG